MKLWIVATFSLLALPCFGFEYQGRALLGGYVATERFSESVDGSQSNDAMAISSRFSLRASQMTAYHLEGLVDVRDKHDFFDKLDRERLELKSKNKLQLRQLAVGMPPKNKSAYGTFGRFSIPEAGAVYCDGLMLGWGLNSSMRTAVLAGFNPKRSDQSYLEWSKDAQSYGALFYFQPTPGQWDELIHSSTALVAQRRDSKIERFYWFENMIYQPSRLLSVRTLSYLDFTPSLRVQNLSLSGTSQHFEPWTLGGSYQVIDAIEYRHRQGIRERLESSPYQQLALQADYKLSSTNQWGGTMIHGRRSQDQLWKHEYSLTGHWRGLASKHLNLWTTFGYRDQFISHDLFTALRLGYFAKKFEVEVKESIAYEMYKARDNLIPVISELSSAYYFSRTFFGAASAEHAFDSSVSIFSVQLSVGYRFGTRELPALRNSAPGVGTL